MLGNKCRGTYTGTAPTCTGTPKPEITSSQPVPVQPQPVPVHPSQKSPIANLYWYSTNLYRYRRVRFTGIEQDYESNARVRSSFNYQCGITMEKGIKAKGKREKAAFLFLGLGFHKRSVLFHSFIEGL